MKITLCGSIAFITEMYELKESLEKMGHEVQAPPEFIPAESGGQIHSLEYYKHKKSRLKDDDSFWKQHHQRIRDHFDKVEWADCILVANYDKNNIPGYIGPNTLMEMGLAFYLKKPIFVLKNLPGEISYKEELLGLNPIVINEDLSLIN